MPTTPTPTPDVTALAAYYANGDGTITSGNTGHLIGTALTSSTAVVK